MTSLIPGEGSFPSAGELDLGELVQVEARFAAAVVEIMEAAEGLEKLNAEARVERLAEIEAARPEAFGTFVVAVYSAYYTHPLALRAVEAETDYKSVPPQPGGYALQPFDPTILSIPGAREKLWRDPR